MSPGFARTGIFSIRSTKIVPTPVKPLKICTVHDVSPAKITVVRKRIALYPFYNACLLFGQLTNLLLCSVCESLVQFKSQLRNIYSYRLPEHAQIMNSLTTHFHDRRCSHDCLGTLSLNPQNLELQFHNPKYESCRVIMSFPHSPVHCFQTPKFTQLTAWRLVLSMHMHLNTCSPD